MLNSLFTFKRIAFSAAATRQESRETAGKQYSRARALTSPEISFVHGAPEKGAARLSRGGNCYACSEACEAYYTATCDITDDEGVAGPERGSGK